MATAHDIYKGLKIFDTLKPGADTNADHDVIYCEGPPPSEIEEAVLDLLYEWGWHWSKAQESWLHYT